MILRIGSFFMSVMVSGATIALPVVAQGSPPYQIYREPAEVVSVNRDRLIQGSKFGKALIDALTILQQRLVEENASLAADLEREERELTDVRKTIASGEFSILAKAFDEKVKEVRRRQDQKAIELAQALEGAKFRFFNEAEQMITQLMKDNGIVFVLDESAVWIAQGGDITKLIIKRLDAAFQAGQLPLE